MIFIDFICKSLTVMALVNFMPSVHTHANQLYRLTNKIMWQQLFQPHSFSYSHTGRFMKWLGRQVSITLQLKWIVVINFYPVTPQLISHDRRVSLFLFSTGPFPSSLSPATAKPSSGQILLPFPLCGLKVPPSLEENEGRKTWEGMGVEVSSASGGQEWG